MKNILVRTIYREVISVSLSVTLVVLIIFMTADIANYLSLVVAGKIALAKVFAIVLLNIPLIAVEYLPFAFLLGVLLVFGRMAQDSELVILLASGIGFDKLYQIIIKLGSIISIILLVLALFGFPIIKQQVAHLKQNISRGISLENLKSGKFYELDGGNRVIYTEKIKNGAMTNVFLQVEADNTRHLFKAKSGKIEIDKSNNKMLSLFDGTRYSNKLSSFEYSITHYQKHSFLLFAKAARSTKINFETASVGTLLKNLTNKKANAELQIRLSIPIMIIVLMIVGVAFCKYKPRASKYGKFLPGILFYFAYFNFIHVAKHNIETGELAPQFGMWVVHLTFSVVVAILVWQTLSPFPKNANN